MDARGLHFIAPKRVACQLGHRSVYAETRQMTGKKNGAPVKKVSRFKLSAGLWKNKNADEVFVRINSA
jgi:hypothetical protein